MIQMNETDLDDILIREIVAAVPKVLIKKHVANLCGINPKTFYTWMSNGKRDLEEGKDGTIYAKLKMAYEKKCSEVLAGMLASLRSRPRNYGAITWELEKMFKDDFEAKSSAHKQLEDLVFNYLRPMADSGGMEDVRKKIEELHSGGD